ARGHDRRHPRQPRPHVRQGRLPARAAGRPPPGARLGGDVPRLSVRPLHLRAHAGGRWCELAAPLDDEPAGRDDPGADRARALLPGRLTGRRIHSPGGIRIYAPDMTLRLHRVSDEQWQRLAAARRNEDRAATPQRASIRAIEIELRTLSTGVAPADY